MAQLFKQYVETVPPNKQKSPASQYGVTDIFKILVISPKIKINGKTKILEIRNKIEVPRSTGVFSKRSFEIEICKAKNRQANKIKKSPPKEILPS